MLDAHASPYIYAPAHIYAAPYVHAETHIDAASHIDANRCDRSGNTVHTNRSALSTWLDSRSVLCAGWHVDTDPKADSDQHANGQAYVNANLHADAYRGGRRRWRDTTYEDSHARWAHAYAMQHGRFFDEGFCINFSVRGARKRHDDHQREAKSVHRHGVSQRVPH